MIVTFHLRLVAAFFVLAGVSPVPALAGQMTVGIHGGLTRATSSDFDALFGFDTTEKESGSPARLGLTATIPVSPTFGVRFEGSYIRTGFSSYYEYWLPPILCDCFFPPCLPPCPTTPPAVKERVRAELDLDYLRLSAMARVGTPMEGRGPAVYLMVGPYFGFTTSWSQAYADFLRPDDDPSTADFGVSGGFGAQVGVTSGVRAALEVLYDLGMHDVRGGATNRALSLLAGLMFSV